MSNKKETPVSWLVEQLVKMDKQLDGRRKNEDATVMKMNPSKILKKALQMESKKQQKYNEMLVMLEICKQTTSSFDMHQDLEQLIKEAKEL